MKAIRTRYSGPTVHRASRMTATDSDGNRFTTSFRYEVNDMHEYAAYSLMRKMGWDNELAGGGFGQDLYWIMLPIVGNKVPGWMMYFDALKEKGSNA